MAFLKRYIDQLVLSQDPFYDLKRDCFIKAEKWMASNKFRKKNLAVQPIIESNKVAAQTWMKTQRAQRPLVRI